jgi:hypothetical protein
MRAGSNVPAGSHVDVLSRTVLGRLLLRIEARRIDRQSMKVRSVRARIAAARFVLLAVAPSSAIYVSSVIVKRSRRLLTRLTRLARD